MAIEFWLTNERNTERVRLPVNPDTLNVTSPFGFNDVTVANLGEVSIFGDRGLKEFSFGTFFPAKYNEAYCEYRGFKAPYTYVAIIEKWRDSKLPIRFIVTGSKINYLVTVREFSYEVERAGNRGDIYFSLTLKQFKWLPVRYETTKTTRPPSTKVKTRTYTTKQNDILLHIAKRLYGDEKMWVKIYEANKDKVKKHAYLVIRPGVKLVIP
jgi:nucleoid-associated protein YgaU